MLKIVCGPNARDGKLLDTATGENIAKRVSIRRIVIDPSDPLVVAEAELVFFEVEVEAGRMLWKSLNPATGDYGNVRSITFDDGTVVDLGEGVPRVRGGRRAVRGTG